MSYDHNYKGHPLLSEFSKLLSHLNSEEDSMAFEFEMKLQEACKSLDKLDALEAGGVDNWPGYGDCFDDEDEEEETSSFTLHVAGNPALPYESNSVVLANTNACELSLLNRSDVTSQVFKTISEYIFDDFETVEESHFQQDELFITAISEVSEEESKDLYDIIKRNCYDTGVLENVRPKDFEGTWMVKATRSDSNGVYWDLVGEICKCHEVIETKTVKEWKPVNVIKPEKESVPSKRPFQK